MKLTPGAQQILFPGQVQSRSELNLLKPKKEILFFSGKSCLFATPNLMTESDKFYVLFHKQTNKQSENGRVSVVRIGNCCKHFYSNFFFRETFLFELSKLYFKL